MKNFNKIEEIIKEVISCLNIKHLKELPIDEDILYNNDSHKDNLISELKFDLSKIRYNGVLPFIIKKGKCNYCHPNNKTYTFHNPDTNELIVRAVIDKIDNQNYIIKICEDKPTPKLKPQSINNIPF